MKKYPSYCCQNCGELIGWIGRIMPFHKCKAGRTMNERIKQFEKQCWDHQTNHLDTEKFAELIVRQCINREELLGAIARGWCSEKNSHKTMDPDLALAIFDEVERQIKQQFGVE